MEILVDILTAIFVVSVAITALFFGFLWRENYTQKIRKEKRK